MSTIPWQVGVTINEKFLYINRATGVGVTGAVQGDFTIRISNGSTGNVSTTGLTITEVSAANDPGHYAVQVSGSTGFHASTAGEYTVEIFLTSDPTYQWAMTFHITANGDWDGTRGAVSFTATSGNGRVTDGSSALQSATVRIRDANNRILYQTLTTIAGLWGPVYLDAGTYTVDVQKSGYTTSTSATITVSGSTATLSPATDIAITAASSGTGLTASDLTAYAKRMGRNKTGAQSDTEAFQIVNDALDLISQEDIWPFLITDADLTLQEPYDTGTLTMTNGDATVTLAGGTWPSWAASGRLLIDGRIYPVTTRTSGSDIELRTAWAKATATVTAWSIFQNEYELATDLMRFGRLYPGEAWVWDAEPVSYEKLLDVQNDFTSFKDQNPRLWALKGSKLAIYPPPSETLTIRYSYYKKPAALTSAGDEADWDRNHVLLLRRAIDWMCSLRYEDCVAGKPEQCQERYYAILAKARNNGRRNIILPNVGSRAQRVRGGDIELQS